MTRGTRRPAHRARRPPRHGAHRERPRAHRGRPLLRRRRERHEERPRRHDRPRRDARPAPRCACDLTLVFYAREEGPFAENELGPVLEQRPGARRTSTSRCASSRRTTSCTSAAWVRSTPRSRSRGARPTARGPGRGRTRSRKAAGFLAELGALAPRESVIDGLAYRTRDDRHAGAGRRPRAQRRARSLRPEREPSLRARPNARRGRGATSARSSATARDVEFTDLSPAARPSASHPLVQALVAAGVRAVEPKQAWTDVARFAALGRRGRELRPRRERPGAPEERVDVAGARPRGLRHRRSGGWRRSRDPTMMPGHGPERRCDVSAGSALCVVLLAASSLPKKPGAATQARTGAGPSASASPRRAAPAAAANDADVTKYPDQNADNQTLADHAMTATARTETGATGGKLVGPEARNAGRQDRRPRGLRSRGLRRPERPDQQAQAGCRDRIRRPWGVSTRLARRRRRDARPAAAGGALDSAASSRRVASAPRASR